MTQSSALPETLFVRYTEMEWVRQLSRLGDLDEVNFWEPTPRGVGVRRGDLILFRLREGEGGFVVGGGFYERYSEALIDHAWEAFGLQNGAQSLAALRLRVGKALAPYRQKCLSRGTIHARDLLPPNYDLPAHYKIGCVCLVRPFFFRKRDWFRIPDWQHGQSGHKYSLRNPDGQWLWSHLQSLEPTRRAVGDVQLIDDTDTAMNDDLLGGYAPGRIIPQRRGQKAFRMAVIEAYSGQCAFTQERVLPAMEAAHIKPYKGEHRINNSLLLRGDVHSLFDRGYLTVTQEFKIQVSERLKMESERCRRYLALDGRSIRVPQQLKDQPRPDVLLWHNKNCFEHFVPGTPWLWLPEVS